MKLMFHLRSVKNLWTQNFHPIHWATSKTNLPEGKAFQRLPTDALDDAFELDRRPATE
jgi:hypothetical protein